MNIALIVKWIFSYTNNKEALQRKVLCAWSMGNPSMLMLVLGTSGTKPVLCRFVESVIGGSSQAMDVIKQQFRILVEDDHDVDIWNNNWT